MNRFKKELRKAGVKLECDYPFLPYEQGSCTIDSIAVNSEECSVTHYFTSLIVKEFFGRGMTVEQEIK